MGARAYLLLAAIVTVVLVGFPGIDGLLRTAETRLFDTLISHRFRVPAADPSIVILDIDEASLASMAPKHGRWPWPNAVLGDMVTALERAGARAVVFDILFSDWDTQRPASDAAFNAAIATTNNTYFPMLRLDPRNDKLSKIPVGAIPGAHAVNPGASSQETIAIILPKVPAAIDNGRLGTHQVTPDKDGVIRRYPTWTNHAGWRLPSLPYAVAKDWGVTQLSGDDILLNWRGPPFSYTYVPFAEAYDALVLKEKTLPPSFRDKVVIIGSTAPSLFDVKGTPVARIHPGVEILATAIDNLHTGDMLRERPRWAMLGAALILVWAMAIALYRQVRVEKFDIYFGVLQVSLIGLSYLLLNLSHWYIDVSAPLSIGLSFFAVARVYYGYSHGLLANSTKPLADQSFAGESVFAVMAVRLSNANKGELRRLKGLIDTLVARSAVGAGRVTQLVEDPGQIQDVFAGTMLIYWIEQPPGTTWNSEADHMAQQIEQLFASSLHHSRIVLSRQVQHLAGSTPEERRSQAYGIIVATLSGLCSQIQQVTAP